MEQLGKQHCKGVGRRGSQQGFTLVEMAIVLAVIGLILGAVSIGKDVQRNAEYSKIKQKFIDQWVVAYNSHYQRTGVVVADSQTQPRLMVDGANYAAAAGSPISGGNMAVTAPAAICSGAAGPNMGRAMQAVVGTLSYDLRGLMQKAGVRMPPGRAEGSEDRYAYLDSNGNPQEIQVCFQWNPPGTVSGAGNVMVITGLTPDLARYLDQTIDGKADGMTGLFRQENAALTGTAVSGEWATNNTVKYAAAGTATGTGSNLDTDQVATVIAQYKMNQ